MNSLPKTVTRQHGDCDLNPGPSAPESSTLTTRLPSLCVRERRLFSKKHGLTEGQSFIKAAACTIIISNNEMHTRGYKNNIQFRQNKEKERKNMR